MTSSAPNSIELTLQSVHGVLWNKPDSEYASEENLISRVKACVAFSGSAPNMKVSSFTMCPRTGNLVVESNGLECDRSNTSSESASMMSAKFDDPLETKQARRRLSSSQSASSGTTNSTYRPHLQFEMSRDEMKTTSKTTVSDRYHEKTSSSSSTSGEDGSIQLHVMLRSDDLDANSICVEGVATLKVPEKFETLPVTLDLPITPKPTPSTNEESSTGSMIEQQQHRYSDSVRFDSSASIRVVLCLAPHQPQDGLSQDPSSSKTELVLSENLDEIQLGGMMKKMHEKEEIEDARIRAAKLLNMGHHRHQENAAEHQRQQQQQRRNWFLCNGSSEFGNSFQTFFDILKGCGGHRRNLKSKLDPDQDLFLASTMASTIDTRDSLEI